MQAKKLNVLFISSWYPRPSNPTLGIFIQRHAEALSAIHNINVINIFSDPGISKTIIETSQANNVFTITCRYKKTGSAFGKLSGSLRAFRQAYKFLLKEKSEIDIIHLHVIYPAAIFILFTSFFKKKPLVISEHWSGYMKEDGNYKGSLMKLITRSAVKRAKAVIAVSEKMKSSMLYHGLQNNYNIIPNVVNTEIFYPGKEDKSNALFTFIHVSSINDREKNISGILRAIKKLSQKHSGFILKIVGNSPELEHFKKLAGEMEIAKHVHFTGALAPNDVAAELRNADAFILFSNYEGLPCVILEALVTGLPVIASNTGGIPAVINTVNGLLVEPKNEDALSEAMQVMMNDYSRFNKNEIAIDAKNKFNYAAVAKQINEIYQAVR